MWVLGWCCVFLGYVFDCWVGFVKESGLKLFLVGCGCGFRFAVFLGFFFFCGVVFGLFCALLFS